MPTIEPWPWHLFNPVWWLTPNQPLAEAEAAEQKHAEAMINPVPTLPEGQPHNRAQALRLLLEDWRYDNRLDAEVSSIELDDLYDRLKKFWVDTSIDAEMQALWADREKTARTAYKI
jgi:hypothetical protein